MKETTALLSRRHSYRARLLPDALPSVSKELMQLFDDLIDTISFNLPCEQMYLEGTAVSESIVVSLLWNSKDVIPNDIGFKIANIAGILEWPKTYGEAARRLKKYRDTRIVIEPAVDVSTIPYLASSLLRIERDVILNDRNRLKRIVERILCLKPRSINEAAFQLKAALGSVCIEWSDNLADAEDYQAKYVEAVKMAVTALTGFCDLRVS